MNTNSIASTLDQYSHYLGQIYGLPGYALAALSCIVVGYVLRYIKSFPNNAIPLVVIIWGTLATILIADAPAVGSSVRVWLMRNLFAGMVVGLLAWLVHRALLSRIEDWLTSRFPNLLPASQPTQTPPNP